MSGDAIFRGRIYRITNMVNGKVYVGQTVQSLKERFVWHCSVNGFKKTVIGRAIRKYGRENFRIDALQECYSKEEMDQAESYWIKARGTVAPNGYNIRPGGGCHAPVHEETKEKIRKSLKGKKIPPEVLAKRTWLKNRTFTPEWKAKISAKAKLRKFGPGELDNFIKAGRIVLNRPDIKARRRGEGNGNSRLRNDQVRDIRLRYEAGGVTQQELADEYGVIQAHISRIIRKVNWNYSF